jgi:hypothetical protein
MTRTVEIAAARAASRALSRRSTRRLIYPPYDPRARQNAVPRLAIAER